jgi:hypothetical protein
MPVPVGGASLRCEGWSCENAIFGTHRESSKQRYTSNRTQDIASCRDAFTMAGMQPRHSCCLLHRMRSASRSKDVKWQLRVCSPQIRVSAIRSTSMYHATTSVYHATHHLTKSNLCFLTGFLTDSLTGSLYNSYQLSFFSYPVSCNLSVQPSVLFLHPVSLPVSRRVRNTFWKLFEWISFCSELVRVAIWRMFSRLQNSAQRHRLASAIHAQTPRQLPVRYDAFMHSARPVSATKPHL